ncbi:DUF2584 family protein [Coleofasciculus sp. LEGE 07092]|uniref:DUF2584 family protein n=1 Tax=Coleofasciculus sp. LEGE 07081 TaxID=2777967 RepID=UPI001882296F|nr:DUF2584 family protein [Coleofasciculus sp. LEGE 07081]MBE9150744.1 DUF2584 family protein [Coleofasciculus sp. LEGE 07092]
MGMPCEVNNILKLNSFQGYPDELVPKAQHQVAKEGYRIIPTESISVTPSLLLRQFKHL